MATYFRMTRNNTRTRADEAPYKENLIHKGNGSHEGTSNKEESDSDNVLLNRETWNTTPTHGRKNVALVSASVECKVAAVTAVSHELPVLFMTIEGLWRDENDCRLNLERGCGHTMPEHK